MGWPSDWEACRGIWAGCTDRRLQGRHRTHCRDHVSSLAWEHLWVHQDKLENVAGERDVHVSFLDLLPLQPDEDGNGNRFEDNFLTPCRLVILKQG